jgi:hypothetical protein
MNAPKMLPRVSRFTFRIIYVAGEGKADGEYIWRGGGRCLPFLLCTSLIRHSVQRLFLNILEFSGFSEQLP